ncbi:MAG: YitT family protein [Ferruginibacter sp.]|nr:YitT family protein [Ferruginibacter sp.]
MNSYLKQVISRRNNKHSRQHTDETKTYSPYESAKKFRQLKIWVRRLVADFFLIVLGVLSAGFGLKGFLLPNNFIDGGAVGISLLLSKLSGISFSVLLVAVNIPFIVLGYWSISKEFALKTALAILSLAIVVALVPYPHITADKSLVAVFGGFFIGGGIGLAVRGGGVIDGTEVLAININRKLGITIGDIILILNIIIFYFAAWLLSTETALYAILTYLTASKTVDFFIEGIEEYTGVTIISIKYDEIRDMITEKMGRGLTIYKGERGFGKSGHRTIEIKIIYTVLTRLEVSKLKTEIEKIDPEAFVVMNSIKDTRGGMIKKRRLK